MNFTVIYNTSSMKGIEYSFLSKNEESALEFISSKFTTKDFVLINDSTREIIKKGNPDENLVLLGNNKIEKTPYKEYTICVDYFNKDAILKEFADAGFLVEEDAILHNYDMWKLDYKSAYRGTFCHVWTPCGCNGLRFVATTLHESCSEWQQTYFA